MGGKICKGSGSGYDQAKHRVAAQHGSDGT